MGDQFFFWLGASAGAETGSREPSPSVSALTGFDSARSYARCVFGNPDCPICPRVSDEEYYRPGVEL